MAYAISIDPTSVSDRKTVYLCPNCVKAAIVPDLLLATVCSQHQLLYSPTNQLYIEDFSKTLIETITITKTIGTDWDCPCGKTLRHDESKCWWCEGERRAP